MTDRWCFHRAGSSSPAGYYEVSSHTGKEWGGEDRFWYSIKLTRELVPFEESLALRRAGKRIPSIVRVAVRRTFAEIDRLRVRWDREAAR